MVLSWKVSWDIVRDGTQDWVELIAVKILTVMAQKKKNKWLINIWKMLNCTIIKEIQTK